MANPTTNLNITLPEPGAESSRGTWGTTVNSAIQSLDTAIADRGVPSGGADDQILTKNGTDNYATEWAVRLSSVGITGTDGIEVDSGSPVTSAGSITLGINKATLLSLLNAEDGSTADQTATEVKTLYEGNSDTNAFTDSDHTKLDGIETSATVDQTGAEIKTLYQAQTSAFTDAQFTKLAGIAASATVDQTNITGNAGTVTTNANLTGDVTSSGNASTIADGKVNEAKLHVSNAPTDGYILTARSAAAGDMTWEAAGTAGFEPLGTAVAMAIALGIVLIPLLG